MRNILTLLMTLAMASPAAAAKPDAPDMSGTWAELRVLTEVQPVPLVGKVTIAQQFLSLHKLAADGSKVASKGKMCGLRFEASHKRLRPSVAQSFLDALGVLEGRSKLQYNKKRKRWELSAKKRSDVLGANLSRPDDKLPEDADDPRVTDPDKDGRPGVTVSVSGLANGNLYLIQRVTTALRGIVRDKNTVDGIVTWSRDQSVVGASSFILRSPPEGVPHKDRSKHFFRLRRVPEGMTCDGLLKTADSLFRLKASAKP